jgi:molecular chaperone DnaK
LGFGYFFRDDFNTTKIAMSFQEAAGRQERQVPVGIDLGTTFSVIAYLDEAGQPITIPNGAGDLITPSAIFVDEEEVIVGREAVRGSATAPDRYAECFKRDMGYARYQQKVCNLDVPPEILSALVLERLKQDAERRIGPFGSVVITVPAFFDENRRRATQEAGRLAGLEVLDIINEPTAAALAYGYQRGFLDLTGAGSPQPQRVMVYDLGGGTFDVTVLEIDGNRFRALATDGDVLLGGKDFDMRLVDYVAQQFIETHGVDPRSDPQDAAQLLLDAQEAKHALSERTKTTLNCIHAGIRMRVTVTREQFQELTRDLLERTETTCSLVLAEAKLDWSKIDRVLLVGGSSRMPIVAQMLAKLSGKEPDCSQSPDEAVAQGAALYAGMLLGRQEPTARPSCELVNVNSHSLGVVGINPQTRERTNVVLIPKNTALPAQAARMFRLAKAGQRGVRIAVVEGESHRPEDCIALGECNIRDLPPGLPLGTAIEVLYRYAANGRLSVYARVPDVRYSAHVEIVSNGHRELADLESWRAKLLGRGAPAPMSSAAVAPPAGEPQDRAGILQRLDMMYARVGMVAVRGALPASLEQSRQVAMASASELAAVQTNLKELEAGRQRVGAGAEAARLESALARLRGDWQRVQKQADFAHLILGRECVGAGFYPPGTEREAQEILRLQQRLGA